jgi:hypothetical protein
MTRKGVGAKDFEGGLASMRPDHGKLISHEFPLPGSFLGNHYALGVGEGLPMSHRRFGRFPSTCHPAAE